MDEAELGAAGHRSDEKDLPSALARVAEEPFDLAAEIPVRVRLLAVHTRVHVSY